MNLEEYIKNRKEDGNLFWRLSSGDHLNLLEEAIDRICRTEKIFCDANIRNLLQEFEDSGGFDLVEDRHESYSSAVVVVTNVFRFIKKKLEEVKS